MNRQIHIYLFLLFYIFFQQNIKCFSQQKDSCIVFNIYNKKDSTIVYTKFKGSHSMVKLKNGTLFKTAEWLDFNNDFLHLTKGFNSISMPYIGDTVISVKDIQWIFWDGIPRKKLKSKLYYYKVEKIKANCYYRGWNNSYFITDFNFNNYINKQYKNSPSSAPPERTDTTSDHPLDNQPNKR